MKYYRLTTINHHHFLIIQSPLGTSHQRGGHAHGAHVPGRLRGKHAGADVATCPGEAL